MQAFYRLPSGETFYRVLLLHWPLHASAYEMEGCSFCLLSCCLLPSLPVICISLKGPSILLINTELVYSAWPNFAECSERNCFIKREEPLKISCRLSTLFSSFLIQIQGPWFMHVSEKKGTWNSLQIKQTVQKKEKQQSMHLLSN